MALTSTEVGVFLLTLKIITFEQNQYMEITSRVYDLRQIPWRDIEPLQPENLKHIFNYRHLEASIKKHGVTRPFAVWEDPATGTIYTVDGHTRREVYQNMEGIPDLLPAYFIEAKNRQEAIEILLEVYNMNGNAIDGQALREWLQAEEVQVEEVNTESINIWGFLTDEDGEEGDLDGMFKDKDGDDDGGKPDTGAGTIVLSYSEDVAHKVRELLMAIHPDPSTAVMELLEMN